MDIKNVNESSLAEEGSNVVERSILRMLFSNSDSVFFAHFMVRMQMVNEKHPPQSLGMGMSTRQGIFRLSYDLDRLHENDLDDIATVEWIDGHECYHKILSHEAREWAYWDGNEDELKKWHKVFNACWDAEIHEMYPPTGKLIGLVVQIGTQSEGKDTPFTHMPHNLTGEEYFKLYKEKNPNPPPGGGGQGMPGQPGDGSDGEWTASTDGDSVTFKNNKTGEEVTFKMSDQGVPDRESADELNKEVLRQALADALKEARPSMRGMGAGSLLSTVERMIAPPKVAWWHRFRTLVGKHVRFSWKGSWKRVSRRMGEGFRGRIKDHGLTIVIGKDTSGSVEDFELSEFNNEIENIMKVHKVQLLTVIVCDYVVQEVYELRKGMRIPAHEKGRGGTAFEPVFEYVEKNKLKVDMLIYLTDSQGSFPKMKPLYPVIWCVTKESACGKIPWGDVVFMNCDKPKETK